MEMDWIVLQSDPNKIVKPVKRWTFEGQTKRGPQKTTWQIDGLARMNSLQLGQQTKGWL